MKYSKRRRAEKDQIREKDRKDQELENHIKKHTNKIEQTKEELKFYKKKLEDHSRDADLLKQLYDAGFIDIYGNPTSNYRPQRFT